MLTHVPDQELQTLKNTNLQLKISNDKLKNFYFTLLTECADHKTEIAKLKAIIFTQQMVIDDLNQLL